MSKVQVVSSEATSIFCGNLVVGNHDSITLFGIQPQNSLKDYSKKITKLMLKENEELDRTISDILAEIECFESTVNGSIKSFFSRHHRHQKVINEYKKILSYIEDMTLYFKLQQVQLSKEIKLLEKLFETVSSCSNELQCCIEIGKETLKNKCSCTELNNIASISIDGLDMESWYARLEKRIDDLSISHTVSLHSQAQIKILYDNDMLMFDKIASAISNTFPIWQNQMAIMLGIELLDTRLEIQWKITDINERFNKKNPVILKDKKIQKKENSWDLNKICELNQILIVGLNEMARLEKTSEELRKNFIPEIHL